MVVVAYNTHNPVSIGLTHLSNFHVTFNEGKSKNYFNIIRNKSIKILESVVRIQDKVLFFFRYVYYYDFLIYLTKNIKG